MLAELKDAVNKGFNGAIGDLHTRRNYLERLEEMYGHMSEEEAVAALKKGHGHWEMLKDRLADEISRGFSVARLSNETGLKAHQVEAWAADFTYFRIARRIGDESESSRIENALEARFRELDLERESEKTREPGRIETSVTLQVIDGISTARELLEIVDISAPSGSGKTQGVAEYVARARKGEGFDCSVWKVELTEAHSNFKAVLLLMARECISKNYDVHNESKIFDDILNSTQGKGGVFIIEEAQHMADVKNTNGIRIFGGLRRFVDAKAFGLVLVGNNELYRRLKSEQSVQLYSRMAAFRVEISGVLEEDIDNVMAAWGVSGKEERAVCIKIAKGPGALRSLVNTFKRALREFNAITFKTLNSVPKG
jgi:DNA transposition AAA+ family ATPase